MIVSELVAEDTKEVDVIAAQEKEKTRPEADFCSQSKHWTRIPMLKSMKTLLQVIILLAPMAIGRTWDLCLWRKGAIRQAAPAALVRSLALIPASTAAVGF